MPDVPASAPRIDDDRECPVCTAEGSYVRYDNDLVCRVCGHAPHSVNTVDEQEDAWTQWWEARREYDGLYGAERVKMVGGFASVYFD